MESSEGVVVMREIEFGGRFLRQRRVRLDDGREFQLFQYRGEGERVRVRFCPDDQFAQIEEG